MFVGSCNGMFRAIELRTGRVRWETKLSPDQDQYFFHADPVAVDDAIVVGTDRASGASIHALDRSTGKELWRHPAGKGVHGPLAGGNGRAYAARDEGQLLAFDVRSGAVQWSMNLEMPGWEGPGAANDRVFAGTVDGSLYALNGRTGKPEWRVTVGAPVATTPIVSANDVYVATADGSIHRIDAERGVITNTQKMDAALRPKSVPVKTRDAVLVLLGDASGDNRAVVSMDASLGAVRWRVSAEPRWLTSRIFIWGDLMVMGTASGEVMAYCHATGARAWTRTVKGPVRSIGGADDILLVGTQTGALYAMLAPRSCDAK